MTKQNLYKSNPSLRNEIRSDLEENMEKFKDPVVLGELVYRLLEERENTNRILKNLLQKIENLEAKVAKQSQSVMTHETPKEDITLLPKRDQAIYKKVKELGKATAKQIQQAFKYKGRNAASARLNKLYSLNILEKRQVGRTVYFLPKT